MEKVPFVIVNYKETSAEVVFFHPKSNSLPSDLLNQLAVAIQEAGKKRGIKVILLKSEGKVFCAGASFDELLAIKSPEEGRDFFLGFAKVIAAIKNAPCLVLAQIQGKAVGGGVGIMAAADFVIADEQTQIKLSELKIGIGPFVIGPALTRKIGLANFSQLTLNPDFWHSAQWAFESGLINQIVSASDLEKSVQSKLSEFCGFSAEAIFEIKKMFWSPANDIEEQMKHRAEISGRLVLSEETKTILQNFKA